MCTFLLGWYFYGVQTADDDDAVKLFQTHWFLEGYVKPRFGPRVDTAVDYLTLKNRLLTQTLIVHLLRTEKIPFIQSRAAPVVVFSTVGIMIIGFILPWIPAFRPAFSFVQPAPSFVGFLAAELLLYCVEVQLVKVAYIRIFGSWL